MFIYFAFNPFNGKGYVGQTKNDPEKRRRDHINCNSLDQFHLDLKSVSFEWSILEFAIDTKDVLNEREVFWIREKNTLTPNGYNLTAGGVGSDTNYSYRIRGYRITFYQWLGTKKNDHGAVGDFSRKYHVPYWKLNDILPRAARNLSRWEEYFSRLNYGQQEIDRLREVIAIYEKDMENIY